MPGQRCSRLYTLTRLCTLRFPPTQNVYYGEFLIYSDPGDPNRKLEFIP